MSLTRNRIPSFDTLRVVFCLQVVLYHAMFLFASGPIVLPGWLVYTPLGILVNDMASVGGFCVLSGFLLSYREFETGTTEL